LRGALASATPVAVVPIALFWRRRRAFWVLIPLMSLLLAAYVAAFWNSESLLGFPAPDYAHHRLVLDDQGRKFSKRDRGVTLAGLREAGRTAAEVRTMVGM
jgi:hypothetical protein